MTNELQEKLKARRMEFRATIGAALKEHPYTDDELVEVIRPIAEKRLAREEIIAVIAEDLVDELLSSADYN